MSLRVILRSKIVSRSLGWFVNVSKTPLRNTRRFFIMVFIN